jgi:hypothetical protein
MGTKTDCKELNSLLRGEMSAVETYKMALEKLDFNSPHRTELEQNKQSHEQRVELLRSAIVAAGGEPSESSGPWGVFAKAVEGTARAFGDKAAIAALEEGEDHGLKDYKAECEDKDLTQEQRFLITGRLLPLQQQSHDRMSALKKMMA